MKKIFLALMCILLLSTSNLSVLAQEEAKESIKIKNIQPKWWPGNPNPIPGTEDWLFQNMSYGSNASSEVAKACGLKAVKGFFAPSDAVDLVKKFIMGGSFSLTSFGAYFIIDVTIAYGVCLWENGVR